AAGLAAGDGVAMRALAARDAKFEDRRRLVRVSGDVDWAIADAQRTATMRNTRFERQFVCIAGDRLFVDRVLLTGDPGGAAAASATESGGGVFPPGPFLSPIPRRSRRRRRVAGAGRRPG